MVDPKYLTYILFDTRNDQNFFLPVNKPKRMKSHFERYVRLLDKITIQTDVRIWTLLFDSKLGDNSNEYMIWGMSTLPLYFPDTFYR